MKVFLTNALLWFSISILMMSTCAQRDNRFDPYSPFYKVSPPVLNVSLQVDSSRIIANSGDTQYVIIPPARVHFSARGYDAHTNETVQVFLKVYQDGELIDVNTDVSTISRDLVEKGNRKFVFEVIDNNRLVTQRQFEFVVNPGSQPKIICFATKTDTVKTGRYTYVNFTLNVLDYACILDTVKYIYLEEVKSFAVEHSTIKFLDTVSFKLFSNDTGHAEIMAVIIDKRGRTDTARTSLVFTPSDSKEYLKPPLIQKIEFSTDDSVKFCFNPVITIFNGDVSKVRYFWVFGKGRNSRDRNPCETFDVAGIYKVHLTVQDQTGVVSTESVTIIVPRSDIEVPTIKRFNSSPRSGKAPLNVDFKLELSGEQKKIKQVNWFFDDGKTKITTRNLYEDNKYLFPGTYFPKVIVCSSVGCDTATDTIIVSGSEYLQYSPKGDITVGQKVTYYLDGFRQLEYDYIWYFPDTVIQTSQSSCEYVFKNSGTVLIKVSAILKKGKLASSKHLGEIYCNIVKK